ncbi:GerMN domain-containing protein [Streptomyces sp. NPDC003442]
MRDEHTTRGRTARRGKRIGGRARYRPVPPLSAVAALTATVALAGCGISDTGPTAAGAPASGGLTADRAELLRVYFATAYGTWPATRPAPSGAGPQQALNALLGGPSAAERRRGLSTALPTGTHRVRARASPDAVDLYPPWPVAELDKVAVSQLVCTVAAAPGIPGGRKPVDVVVRVHEPDLAGKPWEVMCDRTGTAVPRERARSR